MFNKHIFNTLKLTNSMSLVHLFYLISIISIDCLESTKFDHLLTSSSTSGTNIIVGRRAEQNTGRELESNADRLVAIVRDGAHHHTLTGSQLNKTTQKHAHSLTLKSAMLVSESPEKSQDKSVDQSDDDELSFLEGDTTASKRVRTEEEASGKRRRRFDDQHNHKTVSLIGDGSLADILARSTSVGEKYTKDSGNDDSASESYRKVHFLAKNKKSRASLIRSPYEQSATSQPHHSTETNLLKRGPTTSTITTTAATDLADQQNAAIIETTTTPSDVPVATDTTLAEPIIEGNYLLVSSETER